MRGLARVNGKKLCRIALCLPFQNAVISSLPVMLAAAWRGILQTWRG